MNAWGGYNRVSSLRQVEEGFSLEVQDVEARAWAKVEKYRYVPYDEPGISAKDTSRPVYQKMMRDLEAGVIVGVVAQKQDRLWRNRRNREDAIHLITKVWGRHIVTLDGRLDTRKPSTPSDELSSDIHGSLDQFYLRDLSLKVKKGMLYKAKRGEWCGGTVPYGFASVPIPGMPREQTRKGRKRSINQFIIHEDEASVVREMFRLFLDKRTVGGVTKALNAREVWNRGGEAWAQSTVRGILTSPLYAGDLEWNRRSTANPLEEPIYRQGTLPKIIEREEFKEVQRVWADRTYFNTRARVAQYLLSGLIKCGVCGGGMVGQSVWGYKKRSRTEYYRCYGAKHKGSCTGRGTLAKMLEANVVRSLFSLKVNGKRLRALVQEQQGGVDAKRQEQQREVHRLEQALKKIENREERIQLAYEEKVYSFEDLKHRREKAATDRTRVVEALEKAEALLISSKELFNPKDWIKKMAWVEEMETAWDFFNSYDFGWRRRLLQDLVEKVVIGPDGEYFLLKDLSEWQGLFSYEEGALRERPIRRDIPLPGRKSKGADLLCSASQARPGNAPLWSSHP